MARPYVPRPAGVPTMPAPYRFIPISAWVHEPDWASEVSIDRPFKDGVSGWLDYTLTAKTPLLVGGERDTERRIKDDKETLGPTHVHFYRTPEGRYAIPGSSLRGMLRSVLEIAAFGRAAFVDDVRYGLRDLSRSAGPIYQKRFVEEVRDPANDWPKTYKGPNPVYKPKVGAGWMWKVTDPATSAETWMLRPCEFARIAVTELDRIAPGKGVEPALRKRENAFCRRAHWPQPFSACLYVTPTKLHARIWRAKPGQPYVSTAFLEYAEAFSVPRGATSHPLTEGDVVFTGKPADGLHIKPARGAREERQYYGKKKHEFFFHSPSGAAAITDPASTPQYVVYDVTDLSGDFIAVHGKAPGRDGAESWEPDGGKPGWKAAFEDGQPIPVFFLRDENDANRRPSAIGLAMMFRLAHAAKTHDLLKNASEVHVRADVRDFPALLFGAEAVEGTAPWKGRVSVETAEGIDGLHETEPLSVVLATPRGQFFPAYVAQPSSGQNYASYTPLGGGSVELTRPEIAGRKRYPSRRELYLHNQGTDEMRSVLHPLAPGATFKGRVRFHNLKREELGALIWALELWAPSWGDRPDLRNRLGMGKPLGLGDVQIDINGAWIEPNQVQQDGRRPIADTHLAAAHSCADAFAEHMSAAFAKHRRPGANVDWRSSEQMETLLALSDPGFAGAETDLRYMTLDPERDINEFRDARNAGAYLPPAPRRTWPGRRPGPADREVFSRPLVPPMSVKREDPQIHIEPTRFPEGSQWIDIEENANVTILGSDSKRKLLKVLYPNGDIDIIPERRLTK